MFGWDRDVWVNRLVDVDFLIGAEKKKVDGGEGDHCCSGGGLPEYPPMKADSTLMSAMLC